jgi:hypothetical protein
MSSPFRCLPHHGEPFAHQDKDIAHQDERGITAPAPSCHPQSAPDRFTVLCNIGAGPYFMAVAGAVHGPERGVSSHMR